MLAVIALNIFLIEPSSPFKFFVRLPIGVPKVFNAAINLFRE